MAEQRLINVNKEQNFTFLWYLCHGTGSNRKLGSYFGTGPLACLSLFPVAELDKESFKFALDNFVPYTP